MATPAYPFLKNIAVMGSLLLSGCAYSQSVSDISETLDLSNFQEVKQSGNYTVALINAEELSGAAKVTSYYCSAHSFPYNISENVNDVVENITMKSFEQATVKHTAIASDLKDLNDISIEMIQPVVNIICYPKGLGGECIATAYVNGVLSRLDQDNNLQELEISSESSSTTGSGLACEGRANAVKQSIGGALTNFAESYYNFLTADQAK